MLGEKGYAFKLTTGFSMKYSFVEISHSEGERIVRSSIDWEELAHNKYGTTYWNNETGEVMWLSLDGRVKAEYSKLYVPETSFQTHEVIL